MEILDAKIAWWIGYSNKPEVKFLVDEKPPGLGQTNPTWHRFDLDNPNKPMLIQRTEPCTRFVSADLNYKRQGFGGGMRGMGYGIYHLHDGPTLDVPSGWYGSEGAINKLALEHEDIRELLPHEIVGVSYHEPLGDRRQYDLADRGWDSLGMAGTSWDVPYVQAQLEKFCPGVILMPMGTSNDHAPSTNLSAQQGLVIDPGGAGYGWCPYPTDTPYEKPDIDSDVFKNTARMHDIVSARKR